MARGRSGGRSSPMRSSSPSRRSPVPSRPAPVQQKAPVPVAPPPTAMAAPAAPSAGGGMMANIASTAAGVAIGHTIGHAITGSFSGGGNDAPAPVAGDQQQSMAQPMQQQQSRGGNPCEADFQRFLNCTQEQSDISLCDGFNQVFKECKMRASGAGGY